MDTFLFLRKKMENTKRTVTCGELRKGDVGKTVVLNGWVSRSRDLGGLVFIQLRDRYGITQVMVGDGASDEVKKVASSLKSEYVTVQVMKLKKSHLHSKANIVSQLQVQLVPAPIKT